MGDQGYGSLGHTHKSHDSGNPGTKWAKWFGKLREGGGKHTGERASMQACKAAQCPPDRPTRRVRSQAQDF